MRLHVCEEGLLRTVQHAARAIVPSRALHADDDFDARYGTDTDGVVPLWKTGTTAESAKDGTGYATVRESRIRALLDPLPRSAQLMDLGSGKGRTLCVAGMMGFENIVGIELVPEWAATARANLAHLRLRATVEALDVTQATYASGPLAIYLYNPFGATIMASVAERLKAHRGELWVVYINPRWASLFDWMERQPLTVEQAALFSEGSVALFHRA